MDLHVAGHRDKLGVILCKVGTVGDYTSTEHFGFLTCLAAHTRSAISRSTRLALPAWSVLISAPAPAAGPALRRNDDYIIRRRAVQRKTVPQCQRELAARLFRAILGDGEFEGRKRTETLP